MAFTSNYRYFGYDFASEDTDSLVDTSFVGGSTDYSTGFKVGAYISSKSMNTELSVTTLITTTFVDSLMNANVVDPDQDRSSSVTFELDSFIHKTAEERSTYVNHFRDIVVSRLNALRINLLEDVITDTTYSENEDGTINLSIAIRDNT